MKLTKAQKTLLGIIARGKWSGFTPHFDRAHIKHQPNLLLMRSEGWISFSETNPIMRITDAGRAALAAKEGE